MSKTNEKPSLGPAVPISKRESEIKSTPINLNSNKETAELKQLLAAKRDERAQLCLKELREILDKYNCKLVGEPFINENGQVLTNVKLVANEE